ncbi:MAG: hypothetical protein ABI894_16440 [Ilumatobacteraceae bacterium]
MGRAADAVIAGAVRWHLGIGDPTAAAWLIVAAYALAAAMSFRAFAAARDWERQLALIGPREARDQRSLKRLWLLSAITMVVLGLNKQLDLQSLVLQIVRDRAIADGWYNNRRRYQMDFIVVVTLLGLVSTAFISLSLRRVLRRVLPAVAGLGMLTAFVVMRASSFHYDSKVVAYDSPAGTNWILEFPGIALIAVSAWHWRWTERKRIALSVATRRGALVA